MGNTSGAPLRPISLSSANCVEGVAKMSNVRRVIRCVEEDQGVSFRARARGGGPNTGK